MPKNYLLYCVNRFTVYQSVNLQNIVVLGTHHISLLQLFHFHAGNGITQNILNRAENILFVYELV